VIFRFDYLNFPLGVASGSFLKEYVAGKQFRNSNISSDDTFKLAPIPRRAFFEW